MDLSLLQLTQRSYLGSSHSSVRLLFVPADRPPLVTDLLGEGFIESLKVEESEGSYSLIGDALDANNIVMLIAALRQRGWTLLSHDVVSVSPNAVDYTIVMRTFLFERVRPIIAELLWAQYNTKFRSSTVRGQDCPDRAGRRKGQLAGLRRSPTLPP